ncbi:MAG TPA: lycopene beta-cyclase CrtY [Propionibacteriaceae bacterium]|nr:lycopene beta-cyclase CrtY [Propionibacteriaceae bacterium]
MTDAVPVPSGVADAEVDLVILGGGLAGGLVALALTLRRPELRLAVIEEGTVGGNHVWSSFARDVDPAHEWLVAPLISYRWPGYDVAFPGHRRTLGAPYRSITSERFAAVLAERVPAEAFVRGRVAHAEPGRVELADGREIRAKAVLDARGPGDATTLDLGWQKFVGQTLHTEAPHGVVRPMVMDATVPQTDGFRFVYLLPFGPHEIFVEDTYYSDSPALDQPRLRQEIAGYADRRGWRVVKESRLESGVLPVVISGDFPAYWRSTGIDLAKAGMRAGLFHPTTGYSLPDAIRLATRIAAASDLSHTALVGLTSRYAAETWAARGFYRALDTMLFRAAEPDRRYQVLERFYRLSPDLIARFYAAESRRTDQLRILSGRPPVPIGRAVRSLVAPARR